MTTSVIKNRVLPLLLLAVLVLLCGCSGVPVAQDISQKQANEIVALLNRYGISSLAGKSSGSKSKYDVRVKRASYLQAVTLLAENGLPGETESLFSRIIAPKGIMPNPRQVENLRLDYAAGLEIEEKLRTHANISAVKVKVSKYSADQSEPHCSVVIREREAGSVKSDEILSLISGMIPGILQKNVNLVISYDSQTATQVIPAGAINKNGKVITVPLTPFLIWQVPEGSAGMIIFTLVLFFLIVGIAGGVVGYFVAITRGFSGEEKEAPEVGNTALGLDNGRMNLPEV